MDDLYREHILDHYKSPRNYGTLEAADASAEGQNPLCGDQLTIDMTIADDSIAEIRFSGHGCAISQAAASMLTDMVKGRLISDAAAITSDEMTTEVGILPVRLKCALLGLSTLKVALNRHSGTPLPAGIAGLDEIHWH